MAVWQFPLLLVPENWARSHEATIESFLQEDGWQLDVAWDQHRCPNECTEVADKYFTRSDFDDPEAMFWGDEIGDDFSVLSEEEQIVEVRARIDMRGDAKEMTEIVSNIASELGCALLVMERGVFIQPKVDAIRMHASSSRAARYCGRMGVSSGRH